MTNFDLPPFADPQTLPLHVLNPDVNTWSQRSRNQPSEPTPAWCMAQFERLTCRTVQGRVIGCGQPVRVSICAAVAGGENSRAQVI